MVVNGLCIAIVALCSLCKYIVFSVVKKTTENTMYLHKEHKVF